MAFFLKKTAFSTLRLHSQKSDDLLMLSRRGFHVEPGAREKALLAEDPALKHFKSHKTCVSRLKVVGDALTVLVVTGCCYEIYINARKSPVIKRKRMHNCGSPDINAVFHHAKYLLGKGNEHYDDMVQQTFWDPNGS